jgi:hypothetical protein
MAAEATRRRLLVAALVLAVVGVAATGLLVAFRGEPATVDGRDTARGERLRATFAVHVDDDRVAGATATLKLRNPSRQPAYYAAIPCSGPTEPWAAPPGARPQGGLDARLPLRDRLLAAAGTAQSVTLYPDGEIDCDAEGPVELAPGASLTVDFTAADVLDRSTPLRVVAKVHEVTPEGREIALLRLIVPLDAAGGEAGATIDQAVDSFLHDPEVSAFVAAAGDESMLTQVNREDRGWRIGLSSSAGDLSAVVVDGVRVTEVTVSG